MPKKMRAGLARGEAQRVPGHAAGSCRGKGRPLHGRSPRSPQSPWSKAPHREKSPGLGISQQNHLAGEKFATWGEAF